MHSFEITENNRRAIRSIVPGEEKIPPIVNWRQKRSCTAVNFTLAKMNAISKMGDDNSDSNILIKITNNLSL